MVFLEDKDIKLRAIEPEDLASLYQWENDTNLWIAGNTRNPYSRFQLKQYIAQTKFDIFEDNGLRLMVVKKSDHETIGTVDLFDLDLFHSRIALGLYIAADFQGHGYAKKSLSLIEDYIFNFLTINQLYAFISSQNHKSRRLFENDYEMNATLKQWIKTPSGYEDILVYQKFRSYSLSK